MSNSYSGIPLLEAMESAENYNNSIADLICHYCLAPTLVDFGAGTGTFARILKGRGKTVLCVEQDVTLREQLAAKGYTTFSSLQEMPKEQNAIYSINVLEHIENDQEILQKLYTQLAPGGVLFVYVPAFMLLYSSVDKKIGHFRRYTKKSLKDVCKNLPVKACHYSDSLGFFAGLTFKLLDSGKGDLSPGSIRFYDKVVYPLSRLLDKITHPFFGKNVLIIIQKN